MSGAQPDWLDRITMVITELDTGGAEKAFVRIAIGLKSLGWRVEVVSVRDRGPLTQELEAAGISVAALNCHGPGDPRSVFRLWRRLKKSPPAAILSFLHQANLAGRIAGRLAGVPVIISGIRVADRRPAVVWTERFTRCCVDHYVGVSSGVTRVHQEICGIGPDRVSTIVNGVDVETIQRTSAAPRSELSCSATDRIILSVGRLTAQKAPLDLVEAFAQLPETLRGACRLFFVGEGPLRDVMEQRIETLGLSSGIRLLGWRPDVAALMKCADVMVLSSHWEGLPNVVLEALAAGVPVIASDVDGVGDVAARVSTGLTLYPAGQVGPLRERLESFLQNDVHTSEAQTTGHRISQVVLPKEFTWDACVHSYHDLLLRLLSERGFRHVG